ncbi:uncharacterized protein LOC107422608 isoform X2 [Ziziphus jujuba]|uniref:Uncharacterized protein LOC107422608 isoform X2 n=1 Tax=Ziziphus jujuba TaxID=326968 RepID=A0A6P3ZZ64_ZIZJJ|nr:uncharacterized protein LOC107422608 isoform X2 [Ziziphus jujuba]
MGGIHSKNRKKNMFEKDVKGLKEKIRFIQEEMNEIMYEREKEGVVYEREMMVFAFKEAEWKQERKKLREEVKILKKMVEEKEERIKGMEDGIVSMEGEKMRNGKELGLLGNSFLVEQMREERARRDETVEKWKQLYLAIKVELDDLIQRTHQDGLYWKEEEEDIAEELKAELQAKEETIKALESKLGSMENELYNKEREVDILRQSLRIMTSKKVIQTKDLLKNYQPKTLPSA